MHNNNDNNNHQRTEASNQMPAASHRPAGSSCPAASYKGYRSMQTKRKTVQRQDASADGCPRDTNRCTDTRGLKPHPQPGEKVSLCAVLIRIFPYEMPPRPCVNIMEPSSSIGRLDFCVHRSGSSLVNHRHDIHGAETTAMTLRAGTEVG